MGTAVEKLKRLESKAPSKWREEAECRIANRSWLRRSQSVAMKMLDKMSELKLTQAQVAEKLGCTQQYVSKIVKGSENLTLEMLSKIEDALGIIIFA